MSLAPVYRGGSRHLCIEYIAFEVGTSADTFAEKFLLMLMGAERRDRGPPSA